ncbi:MAG: arylsulfatase [Planctomycetaceae bacterium]|jgi:arylsulfatase A-like enzyme|nr:arylsulfatase [Planctomycetaceae bacterium]
MMKAYFWFPLILLLSGSLTLFANENAERPNIVIFLADDLGWADVGWHGTEIKTPNLDLLASQGVKLEQFYVQPVCSPTRASLMTGRHTFRYGLQNVVRPWADYGLPTEERTLAEALRDAGYYTAITGKWHLGEVEKKYLPLQRGFDYHYGFYRGAIDYYEHTASGVGGLDWHRNGKPLREEGYSTDLIADDAVRVIKNHDDVKQPLFLYVPFNAVHGPYQETPEKNLYEQYTDLKGTRKIYAGMIASMDNAVGQIVKALEDKGIKDNTLIFFSSDNGGPQPKVVTDNGPLRGGKATLYEGGLRVPAFVVWPGKIKPDTVTEQPIHIVDLYPTLIGIAGGTLEQKLPLDGIDLKELFLENKPLARKEIPLYSIPNMGAIRVGDWKLVRSRTQNMVAAIEQPGLTNNLESKTELFNLADDPNEKNNLAESNPEKLKELFDRLEAYTKQTVTPLGSKPRSPDYKPKEVWGYFD